ncbi:unnamed protein product, partial [Amoebophrya sp. A25]|eukprot:GSA25T00024959001.1
MERYFAQFMTNPSFNVRYVKSGTLAYTYKVDFKAMTQVNANTSKKRNIRRVSNKPAGLGPNETCGNAPAFSGASFPPSSPSNSNETTATMKKKANDPSDPLKLKPLFLTGEGNVSKKQASPDFGRTWLDILKPVLEANLPSAEKYIGPNRDPAIIPVRELTFQALKPHAPEDWKLIVIGQSPFPRLESATGIAHFDADVSDWNDKKFGASTTLRCLLKACAMQKFGISAVPQNTPVNDLRKLLADKNIIKTPKDWFQYCLSQGVLFINAAMTMHQETKDNKKQSANATVGPHAAFWRETIAKVVDAILHARSCKKGKKKGVVFAWWGATSLQSKAQLAPLFQKYVNSGFPIEHVEGVGPFAYFDKFCDPPLMMQRLNDALVKVKETPVDWLPTVQSFEQKMMECTTSSKGGGGGADLLGAASLQNMGVFLQSTLDLHKMYLERLQDGLKLSTGNDTLAPIDGVFQQPLVTIDKAFVDAYLKSSAKNSRSWAEDANPKEAAKLTTDEKAAIHLYTGNSLYHKLNQALRNADRSAVKTYLKYLRLLMQALTKVDPTSCTSTTGTSNAMKKIKQDT